MDSPHARLTVLTEALLGIVTRLSVSFVSELEVR